MKSNTSKSINKCNIYEDICIYKIYVCTCVYLCVYMEISNVTAKQYELQHSLENPHQQNARLSYGSGKIPGVLCAKCFMVQ